MRFAARKAGTSGIESLGASPQASARPGRLLRRRLGLLGLLWLLAAPTAYSSPPASDPASAPQTPVALDPSARLPKGGSAIEQWDLTAELDSGHRVVVRFIITNTGPGNRNAVVLGHVIRPRERPHLFKKGKLRKKWTLSDDRRVLDISSTDLFLRDPTYRLHVSMGDVKIDLHFSPDTHEPTPPEATPPGYSLELLALAAPVNGTLWLADMPEELAVRGHAALVHSWTSESEGDLAHRRIDFHKFADGVSLYGFDLTTPQGTRTQWLVAGDAGETLTSSTSFRADLTGSVSDLETAGYWVPAEIRLAGNGVSGEIGLKKTLLENDPLQVLPGFVRWVVSLTMKPFRVWAESQFDVTLRARSDETPIRITGAGVTTLTFLNPLKRDTTLMLDTTKVASGRASSTTE